MSNNEAALNLLRELMRDSIGPSAVVPRCGHYGVYGDWIIRARKLLQDTASQPTKDAA